MVNSLEILTNREEKNLYLKKYLNDYFVITLKCNIPGSNKNLSIAYLLINYFDKILNNYGYIKNDVLDGPDGPMYIYLVSKDTQNDLKETMVKIEELPLGRFIDIDVYCNLKSENRKNLRKCYICNDDAFICIRQRKHTLDELLEYMNKETLIHFSKYIKQICDESIMTELNIHPKFGLVTPFTNGSHKDMDYELMIKAKESILDAFVQMFYIGYQNHDLNIIFNNIRKIGIDAEENMLRTTKGINAYKGLIFALGLVVTAVGFKLSHYNDEINIFEFIKKMTYGLTNELKSGLDTYGKIAYQKYRISGARGEAEAGFPNVQNLISYSKTESSKLNWLIYLISNVDDTVLLKRCGSLESYNNVKELFKKQNLDINKLDQYCQKNNLSFGGAADLLIVTIFILKFNEIISIIN